MQLHDPARLRLQEQGKITLVDSRAVPDKKGRLVRRQPAGKPCFFLSLGPPAHVWPWVMALLQRCEGRKATHTAIQLQRGLFTASMEIIDAPRALYIEATPPSAGAVPVMTPARRKRLAPRQQPAAALKLASIVADDLLGPPAMNGSVAAASMAKPAPSTASESAKSIPAALPGVEATSPAPEKPAQPRKRCSIVFPAHTAERCFSSPQLGCVTSVVGSLMHRATDAEAVWCVCSWKNVLKSRLLRRRDVYATVVRQWERDRALPAGQRARRRSEVFRRLDNLVPTGSLRAANPIIIIKVRVCCHHTRLSIGAATC